MEHCVLEEEAFDFLEDIDFALGPSATACSAALRVPTAQLESDSVDLFTDFSDRIPQPVHQRRLQEPAQLDKSLLSNNMHYQRLLDEACAGFAHGNLPQENSLLHTAAGAYNITAQTAAATSSLLESTSAQALQCIADKPHRLQQAPSKAVESSRRAQRKYKEKQKASSCNNSLYFDCSCHLAGTTCAAQSDELQLLGSPL